MPSPRRQPSSILSEDTDEARKSRATAPGRRRLILLVVGLLVVVLAVVGVVILRHKTTTQPPSGVATDSQLSDPVPPVASDDQTKADKGSYVEVLFDGWSNVVLSGKPLTAKVDDKAVAPVELRPVNANDIAALLATTPDVVTQELARLATDDPTLVCDATGCRTASGPVPTSLLLNPETIPVLGTSYSSYNITSGLYVGRIPTKGSTGTVEVGADGFSPALIPASPEPVKDEFGDKQQPKSENGYLRGRYLVGAGVGHVFTMKTAWLGNGEDPQRYPVSPASNPTNEALAQVAAAKPTLIATGGLSAAFPLADDWSDAHLTYASSPTTGCGPEAVCVPGPVVSTTTRDVKEAAKVCSPTGGHVGVVALQDTVVSLNLTSPTHQYGLGAGGRWGAKPALVKGEQQVHLGVLTLFDGDPILPRTSGGRVDDGDSSAITLDAALAGIRFDGVYWKRC